MIWNPLPAKNQLKLVDGFRMLTDYLHRSNVRSLGTEMAGILKSFISYIFLLLLLLIKTKVSNISMNNEDKDTFIVGCDSGGLFKCSLSSEIPANPSLLLINLFLKPYNINKN